MNQNTVIFDSITKIFSGSVSSITNGERQPFTWEEKTNGEIVVRCKAFPGERCRVPAHRVKVIREVEPAYGVEVLEVLDKPKAKAKK